ncbi:MAG: heptosyltransferase [Desulfovibrio sp.]|nr:heptosyltransferase [Desulfovibrio sp.]
MEEYLVIQAARFGDLVQTKRLILSLQRQGHVHLLVDEGLRSLAERLYPQSQIHCLRFHAGKLQAHALKRDLEHLASLPVTDVFNCNCSLLSTTVCRLFDREQIKGYRPPQLGRGIERSELLRYVARLTKKRAQAAFNLVDVWAHLTPNPIPPESVNPKAQGQGSGLGVVLAGQEARRSLPPELLADLIRVYVNIHHFRRIVFLGTDREKKAGHMLRRALPGNLQKLIDDLCGKTDFAALAEALQGLDLVLTPDTGSMHLCAHLGVPVRAFFLSSALCHETGPYGLGHGIWQVQTPCAPCLEQAPCTEHLACLSPLQSREFLRAVSLMEQDGTKEVPLPCHLQYYQNTFDSLGVRARLVAGIDPWQAERDYIRQFLHSLIFHEVLGKKPKLPVEHKASLDELFCHDSDWMLPPKRFA